MDIKVGGFDPRARAVPPDDLFLGCHLPEGVAQIMDSVKLSIIQCCLSEHGIERLEEVVVQVPDGRVPVVLIKRHCEAIRHIDSTLFVPFPQQDPDNPLLGVLRNTIVMVHCR